MVVSEDSGDEQAARDALQAAKQQGRMDTEPDNEDAQVAREHPLVDAVAAAHENIESGPANPQVQSRDQDLAALLAGVDETGDIEELVREARVEIGRDPDAGAVSKAAAVSVLVRVGLQAVDEDVAEALVEGKRQFEASSVTY